MTDDSVRRGNGPETITVKPLAIDVGAEIRGVDLSRPLTDRQRQEVWDAFLTWKVIFFRDQKLDKASFVRDGNDIVFGEDGNDDIYGDGVNIAAAEPAARRTAGAFESTSFLSVFAAIASIRCRHPRDQNVFIRISPQSLFQQQHCRRYALCPPSSVEPGDVAVQRRGGKPNGTPWESTWQKTGYRSPASR